MTKNKVVEMAWIIFGIILMNFGFFYFLLPIKLVTGGVSGIAVIFYQFEIGGFRILTSYTILILNAVFLLIGYLFMGKSYFSKTLFGSIFSPLVVFLFEFFSDDPMWLINQFSQNQLLIGSIIGALSIGFGLGTVFRYGGSTGGIDVLQNILHKKFHLSYHISFLVTDGIIVLAGFMIFRNIELFFFSIVTVFIFSRIIDNVSVQGRAGSTLFIITEKDENVKNAIYKSIDRGLTVVDAKGGYSGTDKKLLICVISTRELNFTKHVVENADPEAFTFIAQTKEAVGRGFSKD